MSQDIKQEIQAAIAGSPAHIFMKGTPDWPQCGFSKASCDALNAVGVPYTATNVLEDLDNYRAALLEVTQWPTIPQIFIGGEFVGGCDILLEMVQSGDLQKKVEALATE